MDRYIVKRNLFVYVKPPFVKVYLDFYCRKTKFSFRLLIKKCINIRHDAVNINLKKRNELLRKSILCIKNKTNRPV